MFKAVLRGFLFSCFTFLTIQATSQVNQLQKLVAGDRGENDFFGYDVSVSDSQAIVGAPYYDGTATYTLNMGAIYFFELTHQGTWVQTQKVVDPANRGSDNFGFSVDISDSFAIVGAWGDDGISKRNESRRAEGAAYIYELQNSGAWKLAQRITAPFRSYRDYYGYSVAISGNNAIVGAYGEDEDENNDSTRTEAGGCYFYRRQTSGSWKLSQKVVGNDRASVDYFGYSVDIDGDYGVVGAYGQDYAKRGKNQQLAAGAAYIFKINSLGIWEQEAKIYAQDRSSGDYFGNSVSISGRKVLIGAPREGHDANAKNFRSGSGSAYVFQRLDNGNWYQSSKLVAPDRDAKDYSGNGHNGSSHGSPIDTTNALNQVDSAYFFDGVDDRVVVPHSNSLTFDTSDFTICYWVKKLTKTSNSSNLFGVSKLRSGAFGEWHLGIAGGSNSDLATMTFFSGSTKYKITDTKSLKINEWHFIMGARKSDTLRLYVDNELVAKKHVGTVAMNNKQHKLVIAGHDDNSIFTHAIIDEVRLYRRALNTNERQVLYHCSGGLNCGYQSQQSSNNSASYSDQPSIQTSCIDSLVDISYKTSDSLIDVHFLDSDTGFVVGTNGLILKTTDGGFNWTETRIDSPVIYTGVTFTDRNTGFIVGSTGTILKTSDRGNNWAKVKSGTTAFLTDIHFPTNSVGYISGVPDIVLKTIDSGLTWFNRKPTFTNSKTLCLHFTDTSTGYAGDSVGFLSRTNNSATSWANHYIGAIITDFDFPSENLGFAASPFPLGRIYKTVDAGFNWTSPFSPSISMRLYGVSMSGEKFGYAVGNNGHVTRTDDSGSKWQTYGTITSNTLTAVHALDSSLAYAVGTNGTILKTGCITRNYIVVDSNISTIDTLGDSISIPFRVYGAFNAGNNFIAQLSDSNGSFLNPTNLDTIVATTSDTFHTYIPGNISAGSGYRIRVISNSPSLAEGRYINNGKDITLVMPDTLGWTGAKDSTWSNPGNWHLRMVPDSFHHVIIRKGTYYCSVRPKTIAKCASFYNKAKGQFVLSLGSTFRIKGNIVQDGTWTDRGGWMIFSGASEQEFKGTNSVSFYRVRVDNPKALKLYAEWTVRKTLRVPAGCVFVTTASTGLYINGNVYNFGSFSNRGGQVFFTGSSLQSLYGNQVIVFPQVSINSRTYFRLQDTIHIDTGLVVNPLGYLSLGSANTLYMKGRWQNYGPFRTDSGWVVFQGVRADTLGDSTVFHNLKIVDSAHICAATRVYVNGTFETDGADSFILDRNVSLFINGAFLNNCRFLAKSGRVVFGGSAVQTITGREVVFHRLEIDNSKGVVIDTTVTVNDCIHVANGAKLIIRSGDTVYINGDLIVNGTLEVENGARIYLTGQVINNGTCDFGESVVIARGGGTVLIGGVNPTVFHRLVVNKNTLLQIAHNIQCNDTLRIARAATCSIDGGITLTCKVDLVNHGNLLCAKATIHCNGSNAQTLKGNPFVVGYLIVSNSKGLNWMNQLRVIHRLEITDIGKLICGSGDSLFIEDSLLCDGLIDDSGCFIVFDGSGSHYVLGQPKVASTLRYFIVPMGKTCFLELPLVCSDTFRIAKNAFFHLSKDNSLRLLGQVYNNGRFVDNGGTTTYAGSIWQKPKGNPIHYFRLVIKNSNGFNFQARDSIMDSLSIAPGARCYLPIADSIYLAGHFNKKGSLVPRASHLVCHGPDSVNFTGDSLVCTGLIVRNKKVVNAFLDLGIHRNFYLGPNAKFYLHDSLCLKDSFEIWGGFYGLPASILSFNGGIRHQLLGTPKAFLAHHFYVELGSAFDLNGQTVSIRGNMRIDGRLFPNLGTVILNGTLPQRLLGSRISAFYNLIVENDTLVAITDSCAVLNLLDIKAPSQLVVSNTGVLFIEDSLLCNGQLEAYTLACRKSLNYYINGTGGFTCGNFLPVANTSVQTIHMDMRCRINDSLHLGINDSMHLDFNDTCFIGGGFYCDGRFNQLKGTCAFVGSKNQVITGSAKSLFFYNLAIQNSTHFTLPQGSCFVRNDFTIDSGSVCTLRAGDTLYVGGDLRIRGRLIDLGGTIILNGNSAQEVECSHRIRLSLRQVIISNSSTAGVSFISPLRISYNLQIASGASMFWKSADSLFIDSLFHCDGTFRAHSGYLVFNGKVLQRTTGSPTSLELWHLLVVNRSGFELPPVLRVYKNVYIASTGQLLNSVSFRSRLFLQGHFFNSGSLSILGSTVICTGQNSHRFRGPSAYVFDSLWVEAGDSLYLDTHAIVKTAFVVEARARCFGNGGNTLDIEGAWQSDGRFIANGCHLYCRNGLLPKRTFGMGYLEGAQWTVDKGHRVNCSVPFTCADTLRVNAKDTFLVNGVDSIHLEAVLLCDGYFEQDTGSCIFGRGKTCYIQGKPDSLVFDTLVVEANTTLIIDANIRVKSLLIIKSGASVELSAGLSIWLEGDLINHGTFTDRGGYFICRGTVRQHLRSISQLSIVHLVNLNVSNPVIVECDLEILDSLHIASGAILACNDGHNIYIRKSWFCEGSFIANDGTVHFVGASHQVLLGSATKLQFFNLVIDNANTVVLPSGIAVINRLHNTAASICTLVGQAILTLGGDLVNDGVFVHNKSTIICDRLSPAKLRQRFSGQHQNTEFYRLVVAPGGRLTLGFSIGVNRELIDSGYCNLGTHTLRLKGDLWVDSASNFLADSSVVFSNGDSSQHLRAVEDTLHLGIFKCSNTIDTVRCLSPVFIRDTLLIELSAVLQINPLTTCQIGGAFIHHGQYLNIGAATVFNGLQWQAPTGINSLSYDSVICANRIGLNFPDLTHIRALNIKALAKLDTLLDSSLTLYISGNVYNGSTKAHVRRQVVFAHPKHVVQTIFGSETLGIAYCIVDSSTILHCETSLLCDSLVLIRDSGQLRLASGIRLVLSGHWINNGDLNDLGATAEFNGRIRQRTSGGGFTGFHHLVVNNVQKGLWLHNGVQVKQLLEIKKQGLLRFSNRGDTLFLQGDFLDSCLFHDTLGVFVFNGNKVKPQRVYGPDSMQFSEFIVRKGARVSLSKQARVLHLFEIEDGGEFILSKAIKHRISGSCFITGSFLDSGGTTLFDGIDSQKIVRTVPVPLLYQNIIIENTSGFEVLDQLSAAQLFRVNIGAKAILPAEHRLFINGDCEINGDFNDLGGRVFVGGENTGSWRIADTLHLRYLHIEKDRATDTFLLAGGAILLRDTLQLLSGFVDLKYHPFILGADSHYTAIIPPVGDDLTLLNDSNISVQTWLGDSRAGRCGHAVPLSGLRIGQLSAGNSPELFSESSGFYQPLGSALVSTGEGLSLDLPDSLIASPNPRLSLRGGLIYGDYQHFLQWTSTGYLNGGFNWLSNPFVSPIRLDSSGIGLDDVYPEVYTLGNDQFRVYMNGISLNGGSPFIKRSQAFMLRSTGTGASVTFTEEAKTRIQGNYSLPFNVCKLILTQRNIGYSDEIAIRFNTSSTAGFNANLDAYKLHGYHMNLSTLAGKEQLCIDSRNLPSPSIDSIELNVSVSSTGDYNFRFRETSNLDTSIHFILKDRFLGTSTRINGDNYMAFKVTNDSNSQGKRFVLLYKEGRFVGTPEYQSPLQKASLFSLYPNPAREYFKLSFTDLLSGQTRITVTDAFGNLLMHKTLTDADGEMLVSTANWSAGYYLVRVESEGREEVRSVVVVR